MSKIKKGELILRFYTGDDGLHWWDVTAANNERTHKSDQGFISERSARENFIMLKSFEVVIDEVNISQCENETRQVNE